MPNLPLDTTSGAYTLHDKTFWSGQNECLRFCYCLVADVRLECGLWCSNFSKHNLSGTHTHTRMHARTHARATWVWVFVKFINTANVLLPDKWQYVHLDFPPFCWSGYSSISNPDADLINPFMRSLNHLLLFSFFLVYWFIYCVCQSGCTVCLLFFLFFLH